MTCSIRNQYSLRDGCWLEISQWLQLRDWNNITNAFCMSFYAKKMILKRPLTSDKNKYINLDFQFCVPFALGSQNEKYF